MKLRDQLEVMKASQEGKTIQVEKGTLGNTVWEDLPCIDGGFEYFNWENFDYRIKPKQDVVYANHYPGGARQFRDEPEECKKIAGSDAIRIAVKYIEVLEDE